MLGQHRSTQRKVPRGADDEQALTDDVVALARQYGRFGYRRITALLRDAGWHVNRKRVERIWRREGLKVPQKQPMRGRLWLNDGSCIRLRSEYPGHVWAYDFVEGRTHDGRQFRILTIIDEASRECLALIVARQLKHEDVLAALADLFIARGPPAKIRSDNGSEFIATTVQKWLAQVGVTTLYITPASKRHGFSNRAANPARTARDNGDFAAEIEQVHRKFRCTDQAAAGNCSNSISWPSGSLTNETDMAPKVPGARTSCAPIASRSAWEAAQSRTMNPRGPQLLPALTARLSV